jgi:hydroxymethylpyrimidine pyrophosphatase-like HAD family hydrolase
MVTKSVSLSNPIYEILQQTTGDADVNGALSKILRDFFQLKIQALEEQNANYEKKYGMTFADFDEAMRSGKIENPYSYDIEKDNWDWEASITEIEDLMEYEKWLS